MLAGKKSLADEKQTCKQEPQAQMRRLIDLYLCEVSSSEVGRDSQTDSKQSQQTSTTEADWKCYEAGDLCLLPETAATKALPQKEKCQPDKMRKPLLGNKKRLS
jgi:hypothetical protein